MAFICSECCYLDPSSVMPEHCPGCGGRMKEDEEEAMQFMTKELEEAFAKQGTTGNKGESETIALAHYFSGSGWHWYPVKYDASTRLFWGLVKGLEVERGYFSLDEIESLSSEKYPLEGIERDLCWEPKSLKEIRMKIGG